MTYDENTINDQKKVIESVMEIDKKLHEDNLTGKERTKLMFEQMLRGLFLSGKNN